MNTATLDSIALNSAPASGGKKQTYTTDARLVKVGTKTYTTDAILQAKQSRTYTNDALIQGGSTKFFTTDALLITPYHDAGSWQRMVGNNMTVPIDLNSLGTWSTYSRPTVNPGNRNVAGINVQTGKVEYWDFKAGIWKNYDGTAA